MLLSPELDIFLSLPDRRIRRQNGLSPLLIGPSISEAPCVCVEYPRLFHYKALTTVFTTQTVSHCCISKQIDGFQDPRLFQMQLRLSIQVRRTEFDLRDRSPCKLTLRCDLSRLHIFPALDDARHARPSDLTGVDRLNPLGRVRAPRSDGSSYGMINGSNALTLCGGGTGFKSTCYTGTRAY